jgi:hypothetical protein
MGKLFEGSSELLLTHLVSDRRLSAQQLGRLREILDGKQDKDREQDADSERDGGTRKEKK